MLVLDHMSTRLMVLITSMLPEHTASPGTDTTIRAFRVTQDGKEIAFCWEKYHCEVKAGKKSGGPAYDAHFKCEIDLQNLALSPITISYIIINSADGGEEVAHALIRMFDERTDPRYNDRQDQILSGKSQPIHAPYISPLTGMTSYFSYVPTILEQAAMVMTSGLVSNVLDKIKARFTNCDSPIIYKAITLVDPFELPKHYKLDISASSPVPSLTRGAQYHITAHILGHNRTSCPYDCTTE